VVFAFLVGVQRRGGSPDNLCRVIDKIGERSGSGNGFTTFNLPSLPLEMKGDEPVRGMAICPNTQLGMPAGTLMPFSVDSNI
jgi:hypothetical protein